ncbi:PKD domain-containing protein [Flammeovirga agarivorans]|uniref:PKD domain-containing protein n=1 Tax=Flammeovirga agarivorans TaxID=2726742 RepID=A0A7X8SNV7_9BACT|nr:PKD domain-containing protein [Flammeovirga agarivorans]NLR93580.1 PKD domain-containing protein [Flammeovirga agarivorans]
MRNIYCLLFIVLTLTVFHTSEAQVLKARNLSVIGDDNEFNITEGDIVQGCETLSLQFFIDGLDPTKTYTYSWDLGKNTSLYTIPTPAEQYQQSGDYSISVTISDGENSTQLDGVLHVAGIPDVTFTITNISGEDPQQGCSLDEYQFSVDDPSGLASYKFSVGQYLIDEAPYQKELLAGIYNVTLIGITNEGCQVYTSQSLTVHDDIETTITSSPYVCENTAVISANSIAQTLKRTAPDVVYLWNFGDGTQATGNNITHTFNKEGQFIYDVSLVAYSGSCTPVLTTQRFYTAVEDSLIQKHIPSNSCESYQVMYTHNTSIYPSDLEIVYDFGDGSEPVTHFARDTVYHTYTNITSADIDMYPKAYAGGCVITDTVTVPTFKDALEIAFTTDQEVYCGEDFSVNVEIENRRPLAKYESYYWKTYHYVDGEVSTVSTYDGIDETIILSGYGDHTIQLIGVKNGGECTLDQKKVSSKEISIKLKGKIKGCAPISSDLSFTLFEDTLEYEKEPESIVWTIRDLKTNELYESSVTNSISYTDLPMGLYVSKIVVKLEEGCRYTFFEVLQSGGEVYPKFHIPDTTICNGTSFYFENLTTDAEDGVNLNETIYEWNFDLNRGGKWEVTEERDGSITHEFIGVEEGTVTVGLRAKHYGCTSEVFTQEINILTPNPDYSVVKTLCNASNFYIQNTSTGHDGPFDWTFRVGSSKHNKADQHLTLTTTTVSESPNDHPDYNLIVQDGDTVYTELYLDDPTSLLENSLEYCEVIRYDTTIFSSAPIVSEMIWGLDETDDRSPSTICLGQTFNFRTDYEHFDTHPVTFLWIINNDSIYDQQFDYSFNRLGSYDLRLEMYDRRSRCEVEFDTIIDVKGFQMTSTADSVCAGSTINYSMYDLRIEDDELQSWVWSIDGVPIVSGTTAPIQDSFDYTFTDTKANQHEAYEVSLEVFIDGCSVKQTIPTYITGPKDYLSSATASYYYQCDYVEVTIDPKITYENFFTSYEEEGIFIWDITNLTTGETETISPSNTVRGIHNDSIFIFSQIETGQYQVTLTAEDIIGCTSTSSFNIDVPAVLTAEAGFTPEYTSVSCPQFIQIQDLADGTTGNSRPRYDDINNAQIDIVTWHWNIEREDGKETYFPTSEGAFINYFEPGIHKVSLITEDERGCYFYSDTIDVEVGGVRGITDIVQKIGYAPFTAEMNGIIEYTATDVVDISQFWTSGHGYTATDNPQSFTYENETNEDKSYLPELTFVFKIGSGQQCSYASQNDDTVTVLRLPQRTVSDIFRCAYLGDTTLAVYDSTFTPANKVTDSYSYIGEMTYQWYVDGEKISADLGGADSVVTFTQSDETSPFYVDPNGSSKTFIVESWVDALYTDFEDDSRTHWDYKQGYQKDEFTVQFEPTVILDLSLDTLSCTNKSMVFEAFETSNYQGEINSYLWSFSNGLDTTTTSNELDISFVDEGDYSVTVAAITNLSCETSSATASFSLLESPILAFSVLPTCEGLPLNIEQLSTYNTDLLTVDSSLVSSVLWSIEETGSQYSQLTPDIYLENSGDYTFQLEIAMENGCSFSYSELVTIEINTLPTDYSFDTLHCFEALGDLTIELPNNSNYDYSWEGSSNTTPIHTVSEAGTYYCTIVDNSKSTACERVVEVEVIEPRITPVLQWENVCLGESMTIDASSSFSNVDEDTLTYQYFWNINASFDTVTTSPSLSYTFTTEGTQNISLALLPSQGCLSQTISQDVEIHYLPEVAFEIDTVCQNEPAYFINYSRHLDQLINRSSDQIASVQWDFEYNGTTPNYTSTDINPTHQYDTHGDHNILLSVTTIYGCTVSSEGQIHIREIPEVDLIEDQVICYGEVVTLTVNGGISQLWSTNSNEKQITVAPEEDTFYTVTVDNELGCSVTDTVWVYVIPTFEDTATVYEVCEGIEIELSANVSEYENITQAYSWSSGSTNQTILVDQPGNYTVTNTIVHDSGKECIITKTYEVIYRDLPPSFASIDTVACFDDGFKIELQAPQGDGYVYYWHDTGETTSSVLRSEQDTYAVTITDTSYPTACETYTEIFVDEICGDDFFNPTAFTPNGDGLNDEYHVHSKHAVDIQVSIYNRWGEIIFAKNYENSDAAKEEGEGWNGTYKGKTVPSGVYTAVVSYTSELNGTQHRTSNQITILR